MTINREQHIHKLAQGIKEKAIKSKILGSTVNPEDIDELIYAVYFLGRFDEQNYIAKSGILPVPTSLKVSENATS